MVERPQGAQLVECGCPVIIAGRFIEKRVIIRLLVLLLFCFHPYL